MARLTPTPADPSYNTAGFPRAREFRLPPLPYEDAPDVNAMVLYANPRAVYERDNDNSQHGDGRAATRWNEWDYEEQDKGGGEYPQVLPGWQEGGDNKLKSSSQPGDGPANQCSLSPIPAPRASLPAAARLLLPILVFEPLPTYPSPHPRCRLTAAA
ncbi:hypothetical protein GALMADRAFT_149196 [Galerina marginata CBS 339.88]|uniref:Uncharacterized protein n=1 Tax=Galerina marginata (strain CBS 339.88) TaxID=685588 RepID=A0A067S4U3_GALM3|nr:hypothetical protein GALMADRAFT_149196 [Galerina marginata CBS 339.88]